MHYCNARVDQDKSVELHNYIEERSGSAQLAK